MPMPMHPKHPSGPSPNSPQSKQQPQHRSLGEEGSVQPPSPYRQPGRRSVTLRLLEEVPPSLPSSPFLSSAGAPFRSLARLRSLGLPSAASPSRSDAEGAHAAGRASTVDRGAIVVSWYEGTTSAEMREHVFRCVRRKLGGGGAGKVRLEDVRLLDENATPHGEVVLCPFLPDGSHFLLKFKTSVERPPAPPEVNRRPPYASRAPDSPSAEPSPFPSSPSLDALHGNDRAQHRHRHQQHFQQMRLLKTVAALLERQQRPGRAGMPPVPLMGPVETVPREFPAGEAGDASEGNRTPIASSGAGGVGSGGGAAKMLAGGGATPKRATIGEDRTTDQLIERHLSQLNSLFAQRRSLAGAVEGASSSGDGGAGATSMADGVTMNGTVGGPSAIGARGRRRSWRSSAYYREEKRQVIFVISNYLVLFVGFVALSAEIQSRLPGWMQWVQRNYDSVQNCSTDRDALVECLSDGDLSGLVVSFLLWATRSAASRRVFLFGFGTPKKLWTVVYEALVTAVCWGTSYLFIRRGLNPNTRENFLHKYWKDAVYGSLAGFNAAFMKAVLKNLVPQDVALEALEGGRQLKIFRWLGSASAHPTTHSALKESV